jgi:hypothetical protein
MDPLAALIGGGIGMISNLLGGQMNASSTQAINAANLQQQTWSAEGGYLPGLVANAGKAGLNPLAVLGSRGPNMAVQVGTQPGAGLQQGGQALASAVTRMDLEGRELDIQKKKEEIAHEAVITKNLAIEAARNQRVLNDINEGRTVSGPEPSLNTPGGFVVEGLKRFWERPLQDDAIRSRPGAPVIPSYPTPPRTFRDRFNDYLLGG